MTGTLRSTAKNPVAVALMGILILVFLVLGVGGGGRFQDAFRSVSPDSVVSAGSHSMSSRDFKKIFDQQKERLEQQTQQPLTSEFLVQNGFDQQILSQIGLEQAGLELFQRSGIQPAPSLVDDEIKKLPFAFDKVTGKFSDKQFTQALAAQGLTPRQAEAEISDELAERHFAYALQAGWKVPRIYVALDAVAGLEDRDVSYFIMPISAVPAPAAPTDAQLMGFMKAHAAQLTVPETRVFTLVRFSAKDLAAGIKVDEADIAKEFAFQKDALSTPERRSVIQIPVKTAADGAKAAQRLSAGEDPAVIAKSLGVEAITYDDKPRTAIPDRKLASAAFGLKEGAVAGPVSGDLGLAALKVTKVTPGVTATLDSARAKIEADLRGKQAAKQAYDLSQKFDDARQGGSGLIDAARKAGVPTVSVGPVTDKGADVNGAPNPALDDKILKAAFAQVAGQDGDLQDEGKGEYFALKVDKILPPALPPLAEKRPQLTAAFQRQELITALKAKSEALMAEVRKGATMDKAAAEVGAQVVHQAGMERIKARDYQALGQEFLQGVFGVKSGELFAAGGQNGIYIAKVDAIRPGDPNRTARLLEAVRPRASAAYIKDQLEAVETAARAEYKVTTNLAAARQALGVDPALAAKPAGKAGAPAK